jgi:uroporphyrinogen decarboxylase
MTRQLDAPLTKAEVKKAIERKGPRRVPMLLTHWWGEGLHEQYGDRLKEFDRYPEDVTMVSAWGVDAERMKLSWYDPSKRGGAHDAGGIIPDWKHLDEFIAKMPDPEAPGRFDELLAPAKDAHKADRYLVFAVWHFFFERPWFLRGMENLMMDYYTNPEEVHRLHDALCTRYEGLIRRAARELKPDGFLTSDDLGHQTSLMMSPGKFRELIKPYYARIGRACRECGMHFWLHSCGNNTEIMDDLIESGVSCFHPVQKGTMDMAATAKRWVRKVTFHAGFDVQHTLPHGTPEEVRAEVRRVIDTFDGPAGGLVMAAGNGIVSGTPFENIRAFLDESATYGASHRAKFRK